HELGYWSWMDGVIDPPVTYVGGLAEAVTVTPSYFNAMGWTGPQARGRMGGTTYLETFKVALEHKPRVIFLHQWQEYSGQLEGDGRGPDCNIYTDTYSVELSDDLEPVSLTASGYRGDRGGWGFYYLNLTQALMHLYRGLAGDSTILAVGHPVHNQKVEGSILNVSWSAIGKSPLGYSILVDGLDILRGCIGDATEIPIADLSKGMHTLTVLAEGAVTRYPLSMTEVDKPLATPIPVKVDVVFEVV
ncbi:MAG: hypothetical protein P1S60_11220, partial [Anaerolineae bacterium]|nr:hypothetical protein [Anaerolineae bacterium]